MKIANTEPKELTAGTTAQWTRPVGSYLPQDGWILDYVFIQTSGLKTITATDNGDGFFLATLPADISATFTPADYNWQAFISRPGERYLVDVGTLTIHPDYATQTEGFDARSHVKKVLDALEAMVLGKASKDQQTMTLNGRSLSRYSPEELITWKQHYEMQYAAELRAENLKKGSVMGGKVLVRL